MSIEQFVRATPCNFVLDRALTKEMLKGLRQINSAMPGYTATVKQLEAVLQRRDWQEISVRCDSVETLQWFGVSIGVVQAKSQPSPQLRTRIGRPR